MPARGLEAVCDHFSRSGLALPSVVGPTTEATEFAGLWAAASGRRARPGVLQDVYALERVVPPVAVSRRLRVGTRAEQKLLSTWCYQFVVEAGASGTREDCKRIVSGAWREIGFLCGKDAARSRWRAGRAPRSTACA